ncbi:DUF2344 domain-containing protein [Aminipila butyrica]|uniref:DUF2344 domain-containing protein n=1 Tax=Aminipila butyrica TaxID=433296 RepID=A0A858BTP7_9FIRM|nr:TIGR03936 family radical SAM-associated protein [Aminipila butyrica]QIB69391.1 DUF2344 domain-containing protein [Aminipila butyrica]
MAKYVLKFSKEGFFKYTSHLDLMRFFKRSFKRAGIPLDYSQGFNPHPKMSFAQPLSLGYSSQYELLEFETSASLSAAEISERLQAILPAGLTISACGEYQQEGKSLAALTQAAEYLIAIPLPEAELKGRTDRQLCEDFLAQEQILAKKQKKKSKEWVDMDIKPKIIQLELSFAGEQLFAHAKLDAGSDSNLSPELLIEALLGFLQAQVSRYDIEVLRKKLFFSNKFSI